LRILFVSELFYPYVKGGAEKRFYEIAVRLAAQGHDVHWVAARAWEGPADRDLDGIHLHAIGRPQDLYAEDGKRAVWPALRFTFFLVGALIRRRRIFSSAEVIDSSLYPFFHCFAIRGFLPRKPMVITWHEYWGPYWTEYLGWKGWAGRLVERMTPWTATRVLAVADNVERVLEQAGVPRRKLNIVSNGVDCGRIDAVAPSSEACDVVYFGRLKEHKNVDLLLRATALMAKEMPGIRVTIIGDGPERARLEALSASLGTAGAVRFTGEIESHDEVVARVKGARVFVHPSTKEGGSSITLFEANGCGVPVVAFRSALGIDEAMIEEGVNGLWVEEFTPEALAEVVLRCLATPGLQEQLSSSSKAWAARFDWAKSAAASLSAYRMATKRAR
jgi:glycosyltransferase involved in cell wall biosynthesis